LADIEKRAEDEIEEAVSFAMQSPWPEKSSLFDNLYN
jgi:TPP-dependent pyruvate/acetoin dehydrogenase alpha subunit